MSDLAGSGSALGGLGQAALGAASAPVATVEHVIQPGETLSGIAADHDVSVGDMMAANPQVTQPDTIVAGDRLASNPQASAPASGAETPQPSRADATPEARAPLQSSTAEAPGGAPSPSQTEAATTPQAADPQVAVLGPEDAPSPQLAKALAGVDWRLIQQSQPAAAATGASLPLGARAAGEAVVLQALASDPEAAAALVRLLGETAPPTLLVLAARILASNPRAPALGLATAGLAPRPDGALQPPSVDLPAPAGARDRRIAPDAQGGPGGEETPQAAWIRRSAPAAVAVAVKAAWGCPQPSPSRTGP